MANPKEKIEPGRFYHICDRAVGNELLFKEAADYSEFLSRVEEFLTPFAEIHAYCLLGNHYHLLVRSFEWTPPELFSTQMSRLHSSYARDYFNQKYNRKGGLFIRPFSRVLIKDDFQLAWTFWYIHRNPLHHGVTSDWMDWEYSSFKKYTLNHPGFLTLNFFIDFFGSLDNIILHHELNAEAYLVNNKKYGLEVG